MVLPTNLSYLLFRILAHSSYDEETQVSRFNPVFPAYFPALFLLFTSLQAAIHKAMADQRAQRAFSLPPSGDI
jgi:hypothetical protein